MVSLVPSNVTARPIRPAVDSASRSACTLARSAAWRLTSSPSGTRSETTTKAVVARLRRASLRLTPVGSVNFSPTPWTVWRYRGCCALSPSLLRSHEMWTSMVRSDPPLFPPYLSHQLSLAHDLALALGENTEKIELLGAEARAAHRRASPLEPLRRSRSRRLVSALGRCGTAPEHCPHSRFQLCHREGLYQVVVRAGIGVLTTSSAPLAVITITRTWLTARIMRRSSMPSRSGSPRSRSTRSGCP